MRTKALILFFPFAVFLTETGSFFPAMKKACAAMASKIKLCTKNTKQDACTLNKKKNTCTKTKQQNRCCNKKADKTPAGNSCNDNPDCTTCPVCYTFIFQQQYEWHARQFPVKKIYGLTKTGHTSSYNSSFFHPPHGLQCNS